MPAKRGTKKAQPAEAEPAAPEITAEAEVPAQDDAEETAEAADDAPPEPTNRAERRALAKGKAVPPPVGKVKQYGRGAPAGQTPRHWQGRRGG
ncbi:MAG: hypothetical protein V7603_3636 [Micromonosporaceae bacterium]